MSKNNIILLIIIVAIAVIAGLFLLRGSEDEWICQDGAWVKHGQPSALKPTEPCPGQISNFDQCLEAGYLVMESWPRKCRIPGGQEFVEDIGNELEKADLIKVNNPRPNQLIESPLLIEGEARGFWFFEADFPVKLFDSNGNLLAAAIAQAKGEWMTEDFVPFTAEIEFEAPLTSKGNLILEKDNPSGLPENVDELRIPILFSSQEVQTKTIKLYYYNPELDKDETGNTKCSRDGLIAVERDIAITKTPIQESIKLLLLGKLTEEERAQGVGTEYPLEGLSLKGALLKDGVLTLEFDDSQNKTVGGSCRVGILWFQIESTAKQFPEVKQVRFLPEEIFQP